MTNHMKLTRNQLDELSTLNLARDPWPMWLCEMDAGGASAQHYRKRWHRGSAFVKSVSRRSPDGPQTSGTQQETGVDRSPDGPQTVPRPAQGLEEQHTVYTNNTTPKGVDINNPLLTKPGYYASSSWKPPGCEPLNTHSRPGVTLVGDDVRKLWDTVRNNLLTQHGIKQRWSDAVGLVSYGDRSLGQYPIAFGYVP